MNGCSRCNKEKELFKGYTICFDCLFYLDINLKDYERYMDCDLCKLERRSNVYMETEEFIILDCDSCFVPMAVYKNHTMVLPFIDERNMKDSLEHVARSFFGDTAFFIDRNQRAIKDHVHWHARHITEMTSLGGTR